MPLDKAIKHGKEKRRPYRGSARWDHSCRNHGSCGYCEGNRTHFDKKSRARADKENQEVEFFNYFFLPDPTDVAMDISDELDERFGIQY